MSLIVFLMLIVNLYFFHKLLCSKDQKKLNQNNGVSVGMIGRVELNYRDDRLSVAINHDKSMGDFTFDGVVCELANNKEKILIGDTVKVVKIEGGCIFVELQV